MFEQLRQIIFNKKFSNQTAKNRLQMVLVQDRSGLSSAEMELFKKDLMDVISKYFTIENKHLEVEWKRSDSETALVINTPIAGKLKVLKSQAAVG